MEKVNNFKVILSTSHKLIVELSPHFRLVCKRHSCRKTGNSEWNSWVEQYAKWKIYGNPLDPKDFWVEEKWQPIRANIFKGVKIAKQWYYKHEIIDALNSIENH